MKINKKEEFFKLLSISLLIIFLVLLIILFSIIFEKNNFSDKNNNNVVIFETNQGNIEIELYLNKTPITAGNFKKLVEQGFYDNTKFHRVIEGFMIQGGDPLSKNASLKNKWGTGGTTQIKDEFVENLSNIKGTISMANSGPNTGSSQFFINIADNTYLDFNKEPLQSKHPVFGKVIKGFDIVLKISKLETDNNDRPLNDVIVYKAYMK